MCSGFWAKDASVCSGFLGKNHSENPLSEQPSLQGVLTQRLHLVGEREQLGF